MRPHQLIIEGFGPFRDRQTIDFDAVSHDGIFLITGPTGAGKTSILDALCFALFNAVPGPRGSASDLRSHLSAPSEPTRVELTFSASGRRFRIERTPQYLRPRKRGAGMTMQNHTVALAERIDGEWAGISRTAQETQSFLDGVVGLNAAQFTKLVVLPQGDFAAFLHADPTEREGILERLFATEHFRTVERVLGERATQARRHTEKWEQKRRFLIESAAHASWEALPLPPATPGIIDTLAYLGAAAASAQERAAVASSTASLADQRAVAASDTAGEWRQRRADREALAALRGDEAAWAAGAQDRENIRVQAEQARASHTLRHQLHTLRRAQSDALRLEEEARAAEGDVVSAMLPHAHISVEELSDSDLVTAIAHLDHVQERLERLAQLEQNVLTAETHEKSAAAHAASALSLVTTREAEREACRIENERLRDAFDSLEDTASNRDRLREQERLVAAVQVASAQRDAAHARVINTTQAATSAARTLEATRRAIRADSAGMLASTLIHGEPCPVCGACEHPRPASPLAGGPSSEDEARDEAAEATARSALAGAQSAFDGAASALAVAASAVSDIDADGLAARLLEAEAAVTQRREIRTAMEVALASLRRTEPLVEAARQSANAAQDAHTRAAAALVDAKSRLSEITESTEARPPDGWSRLGLSEPADITMARRTRKAIEALASSRSEWIRLRQEAVVMRRDAQSREQDLVAALAESPFSDITALDAAASLPLEDLELQRERYREHAARLALRRESATILRALDDGISDDDLAKGTAHAHEAAEDERARADITAERAAVAHAAARSAHAEFLRAADDQAEDEERLTALQHDVDVAELVLGTSPTAKSRMSLSSYALAALFADVAAHASDRLVDMTGGRYRFEHDLERRKGDRRAGLGLKVVDTFTDESRDPRTLSGGEGFMASLALALGMADTVRGTTGGIDLDALFLDEGFGTLDPDTLSDVLAVLDRLRTGGRTIGVISHVGELQQVITTRIVVQPGPSGAHVRVESPQAGAYE